MGVVSLLEAIFISVFCVCSQGISRALISSASARMAATLKSQLTESMLYEWMSSLGVSLSGRGEGGDGEDGFRNALRDGVALCHLVNRIKPGSVENVRTVLALTC